MKVARLFILLWINVILAMCLKLRSFLSSCFNCKLELKRVRIVLHFGTAHSHKRPTIIRAILEITNVQ